MIQEDLRVRFSKFLQDSHVLRGLLISATFVSLLSSTVVESQQVISQSSDIYTTSKEDRLSISEDFFIQRLNIFTDRQGGTLFDIFIAFRYQPDVVVSQSRAMQSTAFNPGIPDYRYMVKLLAPLRKPTEMLPKNATWEELVRESVKILFAEPSVIGATVQLRVHPDCKIMAEDVSPRSFWRAATASIGSAPLLPFIPTTEEIDCQ